MVGTLPGAFAPGCFAHPTMLLRRLATHQSETRRVGKGALAPCPPSASRDLRNRWWARCQARSRPAALPTLRCYYGALQRIRAKRVGWAKALLRRAHHRHRGTCETDGGHAARRVRARLLCPPYDATTAPCNASERNA